MLDLSEMQEQHPAKEIEALYRRLYSAKFHHHPLLLSEDKKVFETLGDEFGAAKGQAVVEVYFKSTDKFVRDRGYSPRFILTNIQALIPSLKLPCPAGTHKKAVSIKLDCEDCKREFCWIGDPKDLGTPSYKRLCEDCKKGTRFGF